MYSGERSLDEASQRLEALQAPLGQLVDLGLYLHRSIRPTAQQMFDAWRTEDHWYVVSSNTHNGLPVSDTLTLKLGPDEHIDINQYNGASPTRPIWRFDHWVPYGVNRLKLTSVRVFHEQSGATFPLDIETSVFNAGNSIQLGFLGDDYRNQQDHIDSMLDGMLSLLVE